MGHAFRVYDLRRGGADAQIHEAETYLWPLYRRFHNALHAQIRVYTCRSWRATAGATAPYDLAWNDDDVPGESFLGSFLAIPGKHLVDQIEAEFAKGESVRLFFFNSDADLVFEEVLTPAAVA